MSRPKEIYIFNDMVVDEDYRLAYIRLLKVLFRLEVIDQNCAMDIVMRFKPFFV
jgi:hypothetical protein